MNPEPPYDPAGELAKETFNNEAWMDRSVKPGDSFWQFALGSWLEKHSEGEALSDIIIKAMDSALNANMGSYDSPVAGKMIKLLTQSAPSKSKEIQVIEDFLSTLKRDGDISKADLIRNFGKMADIGCPALVTQLLLPVDGKYKCMLTPGFTLSQVFSLGIELLNEEEEEESQSSYLEEFVIGDVMGLDLNLPDVKAKLNAIKEIDRHGCDDQQRHLQQRDPQLAGRHDRPELRGGVRYARLHAGQRHLAARRDEQPHGFRPDGRDAV